MPFYRARKHFTPPTPPTRWVEFEAPDDDLAYEEANDGVDWRKGEWVEVEKINPIEEYDGGVR